MEQFNDIVRRHFGPQIDEYGLLPGGEGRYWIEFSSPRASLWVGWDRGKTGEVATSIAPLSGGEDDRYRGFRFELYLILRFKGERSEAIRGGAVLPEQLDDELRCRAALMAAHCGKLLRGDAEEFRELEAFIRKDSREYTTRGQMRSATARAGWAWKNGDSEKVVRELTPYEGLLDQIWKERLRAAKAIVEGKEPGSRDTK
jgi:hypothetical protein